MAVREFRGIQFEEAELLAMQAALESGAGPLIDRILVGAANKYEAELHDPETGLERLRFCQGALEYGGLVNLTMREFLGYRIDKEEESGTGQEEAHVPDVMF